MKGDTSWTGGGGGTRPAEKSFGIQHKHTHTQIHTHSYVRVDLSPVRDPTTKTICSESHEKYGSFLLLIIIIDII